MTTTKKETKKDPRQEFLSKMQAGINTITKGLKVSPVGLEPPQGRNGALPSGSLLLDLITGGGYPKHRMTTIAGMSGVGKTTLLLKAEGLALANGTICHHLDLEGAADDSWAKSNNLDMSKYMGARGRPKTLYYIPDFDSGDDSFRYMSRICDLAEKMGAAELDYVANVFFHDSLPASVPESLLENDEAGSSPRLAIMLSEKLPMVRMKLRKANAAYIAINQIKLNPRAQFGSPEYEPGGSAPTFFADLRLRLTAVGKAKRVDDDKKPHALIPTEDGMIKAGGINIENNPDGSEDRYLYTKIKTEKNRVFPPKKETTLRIWSERDGGIGGGIDPVWDVLHFFEMVGLCQFDSKKEVILKGKTFDYYDLKKEILNKQDLYEEAKALLDTGKAFELYFDRLRGDVAQTSEDAVKLDPELEQELEQLEKKEKKGK